MLFNTFFNKSCFLSWQPADSDIDIIVLLDEETADMSSVRQKLADIKVDLSLKYDVVISVITKPFNQYVRNRDLVPFYSTIDKDIKE